MSKNNKSKLSLLKQIEDKKSLVINGIDSDQFSVLQNLCPTDNRESKKIFVYQDYEIADKNYQLLRQHYNTIQMPAKDWEIYSSIIQSQSFLNEQSEVLYKFFIGDFDILIITIKDLLYKHPPKDFFLNQTFLISKDDILPREELVSELVKRGYSQAISVEEPGTFAKRGEIFDIYPIGSHPVRLNYFDELIEDIHNINLRTNKTIREEPQENIEIISGYSSLLNNDFISHFKENFPRPKHTEENLYKNRQKIFHALNDGVFFDELPNFIHYFFEESFSLLNYLYPHQIYFFDFLNLESSLETFREELVNRYENLNPDDENRLKPSPQQVYDFETSINNLDSIKINPLQVEISNNDDTINLNIEQLNLNGNKSQKLDILSRKVSEHRNSDFLIYYSDENFKAEISHFLDHHEPSISQNSITYVKDRLNKGFIYKNENLFFLSQADFYAQKTKKFSKPATSQEDLFAEVFSTLEPGDFLIHKEHGVGKYQGIETITLNDTTNDFLVIEYKDQDKVYVPVYKMSVLQKYASSSSEVALANLKTRKFDLAKQRAAKSIKKLAFSLLELHAKRKLKESHAFSCPEKELTEFEMSFRFIETPDQKKAIEDVYSDMSSKQPMDRLVCGDVGFGKTEVAMRAAYAAVLDSKQVCILVPTTVLALQHFTSFKERFKDFPVNVDYISRFKSAKQAKETLSLLEEGKIDIIIGTHKLLSDSVKFKDLGLMIIDEEQRFGVAHKEKLKLFRESIDTLMLTATPIPRTLQLSFIGLKDLSIIKTPPPKRQSIKSYLIKEDQNTIRIALEKELNRGGQVFIVHNKVSDIESFTSKIRNLVPKAKIIYAHGQLSERELEKRITAFYKHEYDILISTTIIESGIDIPNANTMIIDRADTYGLSQLHQLRGRIGRSDKKAYAYFTIPKLKPLSEIAAKRLKAISQNSSIGSGFALATSDLEIRGSGDILGPEQSGHLSDIGLELYMELLEETINTLKGTEQAKFKDIEIITPFSAFIPKEYIEDSSYRLKYYKKISNTRSAQLLEDYKEEISDQFGQLPSELSNLFEVLYIRIILQRTCIDKLNCRSHSVTINFNEKELNENSAMRDKVLELFMKRPKIYKINPDFSINCKFKDKIKINDLVDFAEYLAQQIKD
ncbi:MAG: transcription-repair coupling factor [Halobacteriovoraceae bacterium]|nr:transcription-repair coupling factor [Halobacteriovoraceae bacterium]|tara:strand:+ start:992 stop:4405 length:3414 start_codon:yes stop_codon:yes gene_type:complete